jgi:hypothetical protein
MNVANYMTDCSFLVRRSESMFISATHHCVLYVMYLSPAGQYNQASSSYGTVVVTVRMSCRIGQQTLNSTTVDNNTKYDITIKNITQMIATVSGKIHFEAFVVSLTD